jgi:hypothetical protein
VAPGDATFLERTLERGGGVCRPVAGRVGADRAGVGSNPAEFVEHVGSVFDLGGFSIRAVARTFQHRLGCIASALVGELS